MTAQVPLPNHRVDMAAIAELAPITAFHISTPRPFCLVLEPHPPPTHDLLHDDLLAPEHREQFFSIVDAVGLVVVRSVPADPQRYREVRGRSSRGRLSQGEYFHHDGCSGPTKPRIVEIRCPDQPVPRTIPTAIAPFPETVYAMVRELPTHLLDQAQLRPWVEQLQSEGQLPSTAFDLVQGLITRFVRRSLSASDARAYFEGVDRRCHAYNEPWHRGESRFIANANPYCTMQHRRAYPPTVTHARPIGRLLKRWPAEEL